MRMSTDVIHAVPLLLLCPVEMGYDRYLSMLLLFFIKNRFFKIKLNDLLTRYLSMLISLARKLIRKFIAQL